ncbi:hypothetical protein UMM65_09240 [Aureibaculum sp. 2210JD6-5]|uniref:hypothetical protein n=1 Tax=Aureibaculum sp. 2210JD6-5 TaxID=3103957 RepID=UPI002AACD1CD|nr:hypothetical protein [Aureibaculum sp. 2210JD6-5]MDY7395424.1 hypothetical protein [Aureibaculum sp. 2210JD6-5]
MKKSKLENIKKSGFKTPKDYFETFEDSVFVKMSSDNFPKKEGFKSPSGYFDSVEDSLFEKLNLEKTKKETGFKVPENYLETVEDKVLKTIKNKQEEPKVINFKTVFLKRLIPIAAAASLLLFIFINYNQTTKDVNLDQLASTEIEQWIDDDLITFDTYEITEVFDDVELESQPIFEEEDIEDYLNGTDIESLILEN